jgi:hypothetical protein
MARRSMSITDDDVEIFIEGEENENTKKTEQDSSLIKSFIASEKQTYEPVEIEKLSPEELDSYLRKFLLAVWKKDGDEFDRLLFVVFCLQLNDISRNIHIVNLL